MKYTLNKAAKLSGRAKSTISKAIKDGRLSAEKPLAVAIKLMLLNYLGVPFSTGDQSPVPASNTHETHATTLKDADLLSLKVTMLEQQLEREQETVSDLRKRLDRSEDRLTALTVQQDSPVATKSWFNRLLGR